MKARSANLRSGFTLLEVVLASVIAVFVMAALYAAINTQLQVMDTSRGVVEQSAVVRALFNRLDVDFGTTVAPTVPIISSGNTSTAAGSTAAASSTGSSTSALTTAAPVLFSVGVQGDNTQVTIYQTRMTRNVINPPNAATSSQMPYACDVRRICYFMASSGGLARQEVLMPTISTSLAALPPTDLDTYSKVLASEVTSMQITYYDGSNWNQTWDGSTLGADGKTPIGPPLAIQFTIVMQVPNSDETVTYNHVVSFDAAPGNPTNVTTSSSSSSSSSP
jgi:prepilin-type N-terminal cleavage/methylation domain-containing protein